MLKTHAVNAFEIHLHHRLANAAGFIQVNMPLGKGGTLSELEAWDIAAFANSHERLQDRQRARVWEPLKWSPAQALQTRASKNSAGSLKRGAVKKMSCRCTKAVYIDFHYSAACMMPSDE